MLKLLVELVTAIAWPFVALYVLIYFRAQLRDSLQALAKKLETVSKVSVGGLSVELQAFIQATGDTELIGILPKLSRRAFERLLDIREKNHSFHLCASGTRHNIEGQVLSLDFDERLEALRELERLQLIKFTEPLWEFESFYEALPGYALERGSTRATGYVQFRLLSEEQLKRATAQAYSLTDLGRRAYDAVFTVVLKQLAPK